MVVSGIDILFGSTIWAVSSIRTSSWLVSWELLSRVGIARGWCAPATRAC